MLLETSYSVGIELKAYIYEACLESAYPYKRTVLTNFVMQYIGYLSTAWCCDGINSVFNEVKTSCNISIVSSKCGDLNF